MSDQTKQISEIIKRVKLELEIAKKSDEYALGQTHEIAASLNEKGCKVDKAQVRGLENLANTTGKISEITDWLKIHIGRDTKREKWSFNGIGHELLSALENLRTDAKQITKTLSQYVLDEDFERQVHLQLCREFLQHISAHFEYEQRNLENEKSKKRAEDAIAAGSVE